MSSFEYPLDRLKNLMMRQGGIMIFGPNYLESTIGLSDYTAGKAVFSCAKVDDLEIPDTLMIDGALIFCHDLTWCKGRKVTSADLKQWTAQLLQGIVLKPESIPGLRPDEIEEPALNMTGDEITNHLLLLVHWGPVPSKHCEQVARSLERAYARIA
ncbi:MAG: hypothetical protein WBM14_16885 [Terracidiphilus sp.]